LFLAVLVVAALGSGYLAVNSGRQASTATSTSQEASTSICTTSGGAGISTPSPFTGAEPVIVTHETCGTAVNVTGAMCTSSEYDAGTPQAFNMTTAVQQQPNRTGIIVSTDYFAMAADQGDTVRFSMKWTNITNILGYFAAGANASSVTSPSGLASAGQVLFNQSGNYQTYSGSAVPPEAGAYAFVFSVPAPEFNDSISFLLMDSAAYDTGITVRAGAPEPQLVSISESSPGVEGGGAFGWDKVPVTVYAPKTTAVNLTSLTLDQGGWLKILPSYLPAVGPQGANATLYMVGIDPTTNQFNNSLFIGASGTDGLTGDAVLSVESSIIPTVISGPGPISLSGGALPYIVSLLYDPSSSAVVSAPSLPVSVSVAGILEQNGSVVPLPSWLNVSYPEQHIVFGNGSNAASTTTLGPGATLTNPIGYETDNVTYNPPSSNFSLVLQPYTPYYFVLVVDGSSAPKADQGVYTVVLDETVGGQHFVSYLDVGAYPLIVP